MCIRDREIKHSDEGTPRLWIVRRISLPGLCFMYSAFDSVAPHRSILVCEAMSCRSFVRGWSQGVERCVTVHTQVLDQPCSYPALFLRSVCLPRLRSAL
eukprot:1123629-Rhodomonas_salina.2